MNAELQRNLGHVLTFTRASARLAADLPNDAYVYAAQRIDTIEREAKLLIAYLSNRAPEPPTQHSTLPTHH